MDPTAFERIRSELASAEHADPATALPYLRTALDEITQLIDSCLADAVIDGELTLRAAADKVGLTENAIGPRLAFTPRLAGYADGGRVNAKGVMRARYDLERGIAPPPPPSSVQPPRGVKPMAFKPRRTKPEPNT